MFSRLWHGLFGVYATTVFVVMVVLNIVQAVLTPWWPWPRVGLRVAVSSAAVPRAYFVSPERRCWFAD